MDDQSSEEETEIPDLTNFDIPSLIRQILSQDTPAHQPEIEEAPVLHLPETEGPYGQFSLSDDPFADFSTDEDSLYRFATEEYPFCQVTKAEATVSKPPTPEDSQFPIEENPFCQVTPLEATVSKPPTTEGSETSSEATFSDPTAIEDSVPHLTTLEAPVHQPETKENLFLRPATPVKDFFRKPVASTSKPDSGSKPLIEKDEGYTCHICGEKFIFENFLRFHLINDHTEPIPSTSTFNPTRDIKTYGKQPEVDKSSVCNICTKKFPSEGDLNEHLSDVHGATKYYVCRECPKKFTRKPDLTKHRISRHETTKSSKKSEERPFLCDDCGCRFTSAHYLEKHNKVVHALTCSACKKSFLRNKSLEAHRKVCLSKSRIEERRRFTCDICGKTFTNRYYLHHHLRSHIQDQRFTCPVCARSFSSQLHLILHQKCHPKGPP